MMIKRVLTMLASSIAISSPTATTATIRACNDEGVLEMNLDDPKASKFVELLKNEGVCSGFDAGEDTLCQTSSYKDKRTTVSFHFKGDSVSLKNQPSVLKSIGEASQIGYSEVTNLDSIRKLNERHVVSGYNKFYTRGMSLNSICMGRAFVVKVEGKWLARQCSNHPQANQ